MNAVTKKPDKPEGPSMNDFRQQLEQRLVSFAEALPPHISPALFKSVLMSAVMADPGLLRADRVSLFEAALHAANDGLLPDKKEGAMVIYNTKLPKVNKTDRDVWIKKVQWMPMIRGVLTKLYNTGQVKSATVGVVYDGDDFRSWTDDEGEHLFHEEGEKQNRDIIRRIYAQVITKSGGVFVETMRADDVDKIRSKSKNKDSGPWVDWWEEMAKKSVFRRLAKRLPMSREIMPLLERDDALYNLDLKASVADQRKPLSSLASRLDDLAGGAGQIADQRGLGEVDFNQSDDRETIDREEKQTKKSASNRNHAQNPDDAGSPSDTSPEGGEAVGSNASTEPAADKSQDRNAEAYREGRSARKKGLSRKAIPAAYRQDKVLTDAFLEGFDEAPDQSHGEGEG